MLPIDTIIQGEALGEMSKLPDNSINLILTDPPYFKVKNEAWDHQWDNPVDFLKWIGMLCEQWQRILKPNGSLYCFASPKMAARVECMVGEYFNVLNNIRWIKEAGWHNKNDKEELRSLLSPWEACIFAEPHGDQYEDESKALHKEVYAPIGRYIQLERERAGLTRNDVEVGLGFVSSSDPTRGTALCYRWEEGSSLPTKETYQRLQKLLNPYNGNEFLRKEYEFLRKEYEDLRKEYEELRRPFSITSEVPYTDVWDFPTVQYYEGKHPCEKPIEMLRHIISASSRPDDIVLDCFGGSCKVADACIQLDRRYLIIEKEAEYVRTAKKRVLAIQPDIAKARLTTKAASLDRWAMPRG
jgi:adenine-specific DNA-methyltransferase